MGMIVLTVMQPAFSAKQESLSAYGVPRNV
jgi:hypothetical protein